MTEIPPLAGRKTGQSRVPKHGSNRVLRAGAPGTAEQLQQRWPNRQRQHPMLRRSVHEFRFALACHVSCSCRDARLRRWT